MWNRKQTPASAMAFGGVMAALAVSFMGLGGMIPVATYVCPVAAMLVEQLVFKVCGKRIAWAWFGAVAILSLIICPDKEAAFVFLFLGYYPVIKPKMDRSRFPVLQKALFFNAAILILYWLLLHLMGMEALRAEFREMSILLIIVLLVLGNLTFFMLDLILSRRPGRRRK